jgi:outer membrane biosynthesis protein TonB
MLPQSQPRKVKNSSKVNLLISLTFHTLIVLALFYFAAREGLLGKQLKKIAVEMVKEKPPEKPKEPEKAKEEPPKVDVPKMDTAKLDAPKEIPSPAGPAVTAPPAVAPEALDVPSFVFTDGAKAVQTSRDPVQLYKGQIEYALRSKWNRPTEMADDNFAAEVEVAVSRRGEISDPAWKSGSGDKRWDDTVREAITATASLNRPPPTNFPPRVLVRFDVQEQTEPLAQ